MRLKLIAGVAEKRTNLPYIIHPMEVADLVSSESEKNKREDLSSSDTWKTRKQETVDRFKNESSKEAKMIAPGDKFWERFNQNDPHEILWYYSAVAESLVFM